MDDTNKREIETTLCGSSWPDMMPRDIGPLRYASLAEMISTSVERYGQRPCLTSMGKTLSYEDLGRFSTAFGGYLQARGLLLGDRIALMMPNVLAWPIAFCGAIRAGLTVVAVNPLYTPRELEQQLLDSGARAIVVLESFAHTLESVVVSTEIEQVIVVRMGDLLGPTGPLVTFGARHVKKIVPDWTIPGHIRFVDALRSGNGLKEPNLGPDDIALLQYTGGTTGVSKAAVLTHGNLLANLEQMRLWADLAYEARGRPEQVTYICALPLYHIFALTVNALTAWDQGGRNVLVADPRDIPGLVRLLGRVRWHFFAGLNTLFNGLLNNPNFAGLNFSEVKLVMGGGMSVQASVAERWKDVTGTIIYEGYGLTETSPVATANRFDGEAFTGTVGLPMPSTEIVIRDQTGQDVTSGGDGEIHIRGPQVMQGYWNRPDETAAAISADGYFRTGDIGRFEPNGHLRIVDRKKDMILVSGFNVYPNEVESVASGHPGVRECAAVGMADPRTGEAVALFVVRGDPALSETDLRAFCASGLTKYKQPKEILFRDELPKSPVGKILRRKLRDELSQ